MKMVPQVAARDNNDGAFRMQAWKACRIVLGLNEYRNAGGNILLLYMPVRVLPATTGPPPEVGPLGRVGHLLSEHGVARSRDQFVLTAPRISRTRTTYITMANSVRLAGSS